MAIKPRYSFHVVETSAEGAVTSIEHVSDTPLRINGGFFVLRPEIFDYIRPGEELVEEPFRRLLAEGRLMAFQYDGFWAPMDTLKDKQELDTLIEQGNPPWVRPRPKPGRG
jgi:glucose-1-phosphate cytidylyltransferase